VAQVTIIYLEDRKQVLLTEAQRIATALERLGATARPCPKHSPNGIPCKRPADHTGQHLYHAADALPPGVVPRTYQLGTTGSQHYIRCRICNTASYHPEDIKQRYCGTCRQFHEIMRTQRILERQR